MLKSQHPPRRSFRPAALSAGEADESHGSRRRKVSYAELLHNLLARCTEPVEDAARAWYVGSITDTAALEEGRRWEPHALLHAWTTDAATLSAAVLAGRVTGYGGVRLRFGHELAIKLEENTRTLSHTRTDKVVQGTLVRDDMKTVGRLLRKARGVLRTLSGRRDALRERTRQVLTAPNHARATKIHTLAEAADEVERLAREVPAQAARDAGATPEFIESLRAASEKATDTTQAHQTQGHEAGDAARALQVLKGRLAHELHTLIAAARDSRKDDPRIPVVKSRRASATKAPAKAPTATPVAAPKPATPPAAPATPVAPVVAPQEPTTEPADPS
jgi:hypothetical protein